MKIILLENENMLQTFHFKNIYSMKIKVAFAVFKNV